MNRSQIMNNVQRGIAQNLKMSKTVVGFELDQKLVDAINKPLTLKFMATKNTDGEPNLVPVKSWKVYRGNTLVYGESMGFKTKKNLEDGNIQMSLMVIIPSLDSWLIKANFESYHRNDEIYEFIAQTPAFRFNNYSNARAVGVAEAIWASQKYGISNTKVRIDFLRAKMASHKVPTLKTHEGNMPLNVMKLLSEKNTMKVIAYIADDGYPVAYPEFGMLPVSSNRIVVKRLEEKRRGFALKDGTRVAISQTTHGIIAFQLKGYFREIDDSTGYIELDRVYTCAPPIPGLRVDIPLLTREE